MKQLLSLFLFLLPCLAWAQYPSNGNQKITLGEQTTADGLIWRGVAADTTTTVKSDTAAYFVLDTVNKKLYFYKVSATPKWNEISGSGGGGSGTVTSITGGTGLTGGTITTSGTLAADTNFLVTRFDTASMLTNYYRSGRTGIIQASDVPTLNQNTTGSAATLTTSRTFQTNLASTSTASFNGSANVTPGVTGTLPVANGGTGQSTLTANKVLVGNGTTGILQPTNLHWDNTNSRLGINNTTPDTKLHVTNAANAFIAKFTGGASSDITFNIYADSGREFASAGVATAHDFNFFTNNYDRFIVRRDGESWFTTANAYPTDQGAYTVQVFQSGVWAAGAYVNGSDANVKENIVDLDSSLNIVNNLKPVIFNYINTSVNNDTKHLGFIAQDVYQTLENKDYLGSIVRSDGETLSIAYSNIIPLLTKAIQEQQTLIKALEQRIINLENK
jgi:hypothetical protein